MDEQLRRKRNFDNLVQLITHPSTFGLFVCSRAIVLVNIITLVKGAINEPVKGRNSLLLIIINHIQRSFNPSVLRLFSAARSSSRSNK